MSKPMFVCFVDEARGATLIRGHGAKALLVLLGYVPRWSTSARGWVVHSTTVADDVMADANLHGSFAVVSHGRPT